MITLVLNEQQASAMPTLLEMFQSLPNVEVILGDRWTFRDRGDLDALLLPHPVAFELLGGLPAQNTIEITLDAFNGREATIRDALLIDASSATNPLPFEIRWVISGPTFLARLGRGKEGTLSMTLNDEGITPDIQDYIIFSRALQIVHHHNKNQRAGLIQRLGCTLDDFAIPTGTGGSNLREMKAIHRACADYLSCTSA